MVSFRGRSIVSIRDMSQDDLTKVVETADLVKRGELSGFLNGKTVATLFFEPSTRTRLSFESAVFKSGGSVFGIANPKASSQSKGESFADSIRTVSGYCDVMVIRHPVEGAARMASELSGTPVINAGDGANQHPTQTFLDLFTIKESLGRLDNLKIGMMGDLKYGRTVHSLTDALAMFNNELIFISPPSLKMPRHILKELDDANIRYRTISDLEEAGDCDLDILYVTRIQKERFGDPQEYEKVAGVYRITQDTINMLGKDVRVMHPLPRVDEIAEEVDSMPNAIYFTQAHNGIPTRQALLGLVTGGLN
ncbi:aspartate carbamoyltransferase [Candidatus Fermentibacteria bacterium]|nr:MAG: aspartate carbamoyltransferase [Candidatus Fermentibacteria bacterium]